MELKEIRVETLPDNSKPQDEEGNELFSDDSNRRSHITGRKCAADVATWGRLEGDDC